MSEETVWAAPEPQGFGGNVPTNAIVRCTHAESAVSSRIPSADTKAMLWIVSITGFPRDASLFERLGLRRELSADGSIRA